MQMQLQATPISSRRAAVLFKNIPSFKTSLIKEQLRQRKSTQIRQSVDVSQFLADLQQQVDISEVQSQVTSVVKDIPQETLLIGAGVGVVVLLLIGVAASQQGGDSTGETAQPKKAATQTRTQKIVKENCVLVFGSARRGGLEIVKKLLSQGKNVVAAVRSEQEGKQIYKDLAQKAKKEFSGNFYLESGIDFTKPETLSQEAFQGVNQVVISLSPAISEGLPEDTPENIDYKAVQNIAEAAQKFLKQKTSETPVLTTISTDKWETIDDVIMGGKSQSKIEALENGNIKFSGTIITEGGGFCGTRVQELKNLSVSDFDGVSFRVKGDGSTLKMNIRTDAESFQERRSDTYQAVFDTVKDVWTEVKLPWWQFQYVTLDGKLRRETYNKPTLNPKKTGEKIVSMSLLSSRFNYNQLPNPNFHDGEFEIEFEKEIKLYKNEVPQIVLVTSAAVERNAVIGDDEQLRAQQIPIIQMNPKNILDWKYAGEKVIRCCGLSYTIVRPNQLKDDEEFSQEDAFLEIQQGDFITGRIGYPQLANVIDTVINEPLAIGKTFEVCKNEAGYAANKTMSGRDFRRMLKGCCTDWERTKFDIPALPVVVLPGQPAPLLEQQQVSPVEEAEKWVAAWKASASTSNGYDASKSSPQPSSNGYAPNEQEAAKWVEAWKAKTTA